MIVHDSCPNCGGKNISVVFLVKDYTVSGEMFQIWECANCTHRFTQNVPSKEEIGKYYQSENYISHTDTRKGFINGLYHTVRRRTLSQKRKLVQNATLKKEGSILDVGCGTGAFLACMKEAKWSFTGLEPDATARQKAKELYGLHLEETEEFVRLPEKSFDAITMWHVLEHVHDLHEYIQQLKNLLKPEGKIFIAVPNYTSYDAAVYKEFWAAYDVPRHLHHFSPRSMQTLISKHGMKIHSIKPMWYDSVYVSLLSEQYKTGKSRIANAFFSGFLSNFKAFTNHSKCSSLIYIIGN